jgi:hypothetical protein
LTNLFFTRYTLSFHIKSLILLAVTIFSIDTNAQQFRYIKNLFKRANPHLNKLERKGNYINKNASFQRFTAIQGNDSLGYYGFDNDTNYVHFVNLNLI